MLESKDVVDRTDCHQDGMTRIAGHHPNSPCSEFCSLIHKPAVHRTCQSLLLLTSVCFGVELLYRTTLGVLCTQYKTRLNWDCLWCVTGTMFISGMQREYGKQKGHQH